MQLFLTGFVPAGFRPALIALACLLPQVAPAGVMYWDNISGGTDTIYSANLDGTGVKTIISLAYSITSFRVTLAYLYANNHTDKAIVRFNLDGTNPTTLINNPAGANTISSLSVDSNNLYYFL